MLMSKCGFATLLIPLGEAGELDWVALVKGHGLTSAMQRGPARAFPHGRR